MYVCVETIGSRKREGGALTVGASLSIMSSFRKRVKTLNESIGLTNLLHISSRIIICYSAVLLLYLGVNRRPICASVPSVLLCAWAHRNWKKLGTKERRLKPPSLRVLLCLLACSRRCGGKVKTITKALTITACS